MTNTLNSEYIYVEPDDKAHIEPDEYPDFGLDDLVDELQWSLDNKRYRALLLLAPQPWTKTEAISCVQRGYADGFQLRENPASCYQVQQGDIVLPYRLDNEDLGARVAEVFRHSYVLWSEPSSD